MGLILPTGIKISDATANTSDVASGKIFYNNDGRQVGTGEISNKLSFIVDNSSGTNEWLYTTVMYNYINQTTNEIYQNYKILPVQDTYKWCQNFSLPSQPYGLILDNVTYYFSVTYSDYVYYFCDRNVVTNELSFYYGIYIYKNVVYTGYDWVGKNLTILY